jgi:hypothetical protein
MFSRLGGSCLAALVLSLPAAAQDKQPPAEEGHYARAEVRGKLVRMGLKEKTWSVVVGGRKEGEGAFYCPLTFPDERTERAARRLEGKVVVVTGSLHPNPNPGGIGGESFLFVPGPIIGVQTLRAAEKR